MASGLSPPENVRHYREQTEDGEDDNEDDETLEETVLRVMLEEKTRRRGVWSGEIKLVSVRVVSADGRK